jgi:hypothetical protein
MLSDFDSKKKFEFSIQMTVDRTEQFLFLILSMI